MHKPQISIILPCLNEQDSIGLCIDQIKEIIKINNLNAELLIVDNGSQDRSLEIIKSKKVHLVQEPIRGYGSAYLAGFKEAKGEYLFIADSDGTYEFSEIPRFIDELKNGYDLVIGNRFQGKMEKGAMKFSHRCLGNPILSFFMRLFFKTDIKDSHCGMRAIRKSSLEKLNLQTTGMEFASEMIIKAIRNNFKIKQIPINYLKRKGKSKLNSFSDAWRHFRFMLLYSPLYLFLIPGLILFLLGISSMMWLSLGKILIESPFYYHPLFLSSMLMIIGYQLIIFSIFAKTYAINHLGEMPVFNNLYRHLNIEKASLFGILIILIGFLLFSTTLFNWATNNFNALIETRKSIIAMTIIILGIQSIFSSFMLSMLGIKEK